MKIQFDLLAETSSTFLPICSHIHEMLYFGKFDEVDKFIEMLMVEDTSILVKVGVLRLTSRAKDELSSWNSARDLFATKIPDAEIIMRGLFDE